MPKDLFSIQTASYQKYRPRYPRELYEHILQFVPNREAAWDCGTGNGQAASVLNEYFQQVKATDISEKQLSLAQPVNGIDYILSPAESTPFAENSFDLITVAQAYHWFNFQLFEIEVRRVGKPGGVIAIWGYNLFTSDNQLLDAAVRNFYKEELGPFWDPERKYLEENYETIPFNFPLLSYKNFSINIQWSTADLAGYLNSWSAVQHFIAKKGYNPVDRLSDEIKACTKDEEKINISIPLFLKLGSIK